MGSCMKLWLFGLLQVALVVMLAPLFAGFIKWVKCQLQNRQGPSILQPYRNLIKLFHKEVIAPTTASKVFYFAPYLVFGVTIVSCFAVPFVVTNLPTNLIADIIVLVGLFALVRFFLALAGMDIGTAFGGMGSSREMLIAAIAEPALLMALFSLAMFAASTNISTIVNFGLFHPPLFHPSLIFAALSFAIVAVAETGRIPVDNPATHLELTMVHEAMILEYSGRYLALIEWSAQIKLLLYAVLLLNLFFPWGLTSLIDFPHLAISFGMLLLKLTTLGIILGMVEINLAKLRLFRVPNLLNFAFLLALLGLLIHIILEIG